VLALIRCFVCFPPKHAHRPRGSYGSRMRVDSTLAGTAVDG
jgi:hypothetical protein